MSGPKYGEAEIREQKALELMLQEQKRIEEKKCIAANKAIKGLIKEMNKEYNKINFPIYDQMVKEIKNEVDPNGLNKLEGYLESIRGLNEIRYDDKSNSEELIKIQQQCEKALQKIKNVSKEIKTTKKQLEMEYNSKASEKKEKEFRNKKWVAKSNNIATVSPRVEEAYRSLISLVIDDANFDVLKSKYMQILNNHNVDDEHKINQFKIRREAYLVDKEASVTCEMIALKNEYLVLTKDLGREVVSIPTSKEELENCISELNNALKARTMGEYIKNSLSEVMNSMGYNIIGSEVVKSADAEMEKSLYEVSEKAALSVCTSDNGAIMFEVMGKSSEKVLSEDEKISIRSEMERFCPDYAEIKARLAEYDIAIGNEKLYKADEKYARAVDAQKFEEGSRRRGRNKEKKIAYYDND